MFLVNSRSHLVSSTALGLGSKSHHQKRRTFSRSYGTILPSSFTRVLSSALVFSTRPPVSVWGTIPYNLKLRGFSWKHGIDHFSRGFPQEIVIASQINEGPDLPNPPTYTLKHRQPSLCQSSLLRHSIAVRTGIGILTDFPSTTAFALALGADSPCPD